MLERYKVEVIDSVANILVEDEQPPVPLVFRRYLGYVDLLNLPKRNPRVGLAYSRAIVLPVRQFLLVFLVLREPLPL